MTAIVSEIHRGTYYDSVFLMGLQTSLRSLPGVLDAAVVMGTRANKEILAQIDLLTGEAKEVVGEDLVVVVKGENEKSARRAMEQLDELMARGRSSDVGEYRPKSLETAAAMLPEARWVLVSVPGRFAAQVARQALELEKHVFLYSDNVSLKDEVSLKRGALAKGLLVMGPDCGTAAINGVGLGFANRIRRGGIGLIGASGTGLQAVMVGIDRLGAGVSHAIGTGGRDLSEEIGGVTTMQALRLLQADPETQVLVVVSKPPSLGVAGQLFAAAQRLEKPVVIHTLGAATPGRRMGNLHFAVTLREAAEIAVGLEGETGRAPASAGPEGPFSAPQRYLRGLFSGGTLALETLVLLRAFGQKVHSNVSLEGSPRLPDPLRSRGHSVIDLGGDEFTVGRLHPMIDNELRLRRLRREAEDPEVAVILLDVVLGDGAHPDPAGELAPVLSACGKKAEEAGRNLQIVALVVGTDSDPQDLSRQMQTLQQAGARVETDLESAVARVGGLILELSREATPPSPSICVAGLQAPFAAVNVGLDHFRHSLLEQGAPVVQVDWRPPAGGNERLIRLLSKMKD
ncbi:MAG: acyl-CoA synthetase FdrA [Acidobacteriota bacterium]